MQRNLLIKKDKNEDKINEQEIRKTIKIFILKARRTDLDNFDEDHDDNEDFGKENGNENTFTDYDENMNKLYISGQNDD